jgi:hypothetical protein
MHTVFSDGLVWPTVRVDEAWREGLDAIAITDHLEYQPHKNDIKADYNRSWQIAREYALKKNVIVIAGTEITKGLPPGHFNAIFIKDANPIFNENYLMAIELAANQGAFITWNHPGWKVQQPDTTKWWEEHTILYNQGWLHGIEVVNYGEYYPEALDWAIEKGLTMMSCSDEHDPFLFKNYTPENHRSVTLVFVTERSEGGIRDALFSGRTVAYTGKKVIGKATFLEALFLQSVQLVEINKKDRSYSFLNSSDLYFTIHLEDNLYRDWVEKITLNPGYESTFTLPAEVDLKNINVSISNLLTGSNQILSLPMLSIKTVYK